MWGRGSSVSENDDVADHYMRSLDKDIADLEVHRQSPLLWNGMMLKENHLMYYIMVWQCY